MDNDEQEKAKIVYDNMPTTLEELWAAVQAGANIYVTENNDLCAFTPEHKIAVYQNGQWVNILDTKVNGLLLHTAGAVRDREAAEHVAAHWFTPSESRQADV